MGMAALLGLKGKDLFALFACNVAGFLVAMMIPDPTWRIYVAILLSYHLFLAWLVFLGEHEAGLSMPLVSTIFTHSACVFLIVVLGLMRARIPFFGILRYAIVGVAIFEHKWMFSVSRHAPAVDEGPVDLLKPRGPQVVTQSPSLVMAPASAALPAGAMQQPAQMTPGIFSQPAVEVPKYQPIVGAPQTAVVPIAQQAPKQEVPDNGKRRRKSDKEPEGSSPLLSASAEDHEAWLRERASGNPTHRKPGMSVKQEYEAWLRARYRARGAEGAKATAR